MNTPPVPLTSPPPSTLPAKPVTRAIISGLASPSAEARKARSVAQEGSRTAQQVIAQIDRYAAGLRKVVSTHDALPEGPAEFKHEGVDITTLKDLLTALESVLDKFAPKS